MIFDLIIVCLVRELQLLMLKSQFQCQSCGATARCFCSMSEDYSKANRGLGSLGLFRVSISSSEDEDTLSECVRGRISVASSHREKSSSSDDNESKASG